MRLSTKVAYCILKNMIYESINTKCDNFGNIYVENSREYLKDKMNISINTITSIYKELIKANLIEEKFIEVGKPNIVFIKNCEMEVTEEIHNICEKEKVEVKQEVVEDKKIELIKEFNYVDVLMTEDWFKEQKIKKFNIEYNLLMKRLDLNEFSRFERQIIEMVLQVLASNKEIKEVKKFDIYTLKRAVDETKKEVRNFDTNVYDVLIDKIKYLSFMNVILH